MSIDQRKRQKKLAKKKAKRKAVLSSKYKHSSTLASSDQWIQFETCESFRDRSQNNHLKPGNSSNKSTILTLFKT